MKTAELLQMESIRLSPDEQRELGRRYYAAADAGDDKTAAECLDKLTRLIYPMIVERASRRWSRSPHFADVVSHVYVGLFDAMIRLRSYDPDKGSFSTWAAFHISRRLAAYHLSEARLVRIPQSSYSQGTPEALAAAKTLETSWTDCPELPADAEPDREADREIADRIRDLAGRIPSPKQRTAVQRRYGLDGRDPETFRQIGDTLGVDPRAIKWRVRAGTDWIRKQCQEEWI
jgi:RNA polymerase sigma factor (sigma-70 family)